MIFNGKECKHTLYYHDLLQAICDAVLLPTQHLLTYLLLTQKDYG
jgi:hypothetical protein